MFGAVSRACLAPEIARAVFYVGYALAIVVALLLSPLLSLALARAMRPVLKWLRPVEGALAADSLIQAPRRTSASVAALMLSLALVVAFAGMARASYDSIIDWMDTALNPDLFVMPSQNIVIRTLRFPPAMAEELAAMPGVERVQKVRDARIMFRQTPVMIVATEMTEHGETAHAAGGRKRRRMYRQPRPARADRVGQSRRAEGAACRRNDRDPRTPRRHPAADRRHRRRLLGSAGHDSDGPVFQQYWHDDSVNVFRIYLSPGAEVPEVKRRILERYAGERQVFVLTNGELKAYILKITDQWFGLTSVQIAVAVLVAILGIVNTLTVSITDRRRELGVLRAVGGCTGRFAERSGWRP